MRKSIPVRGFTLVELLVVVVVVTLIGAGLVLTSCRARTTQYHFSDATQIRGIHQGMVLWAQNNGGAYPLPSRFDLQDQTVTDQGRTKDTSAAIISMLIFNNFFSPELCVSPEESNPAIKVHDTFAFSEPATAVNAKKALWDPAFSADFTGGKIGNLSYAHMLPADERLATTWTNTFSATQAVLGNRGPQVAGFAVTDGARQYSTAATSNTFLIHGGPTTWEGHIAYNDNHVAFESSLAPAGTTYKDVAGVEQPDCLFLDEADDASKVNNFLGIFTKAGATKADYTAIWD